MTKNILVLTITLTLSTFTQAATYDCQSVGENTLSISALLETTMIFNEVKSGKFKYSSLKDNKTVLVKGEFLCDESNEKGNQLCGVVGFPDPNITFVGFNGLFGLGMNISSQKHTVLFSCKKL